MRECGDRIRRERAAPLSPRLALRRVLVLAEGRQFREAAAILARLGPNALAAVSGDLPMDLLLEGLPHSAQLLETLFTKLISAKQRANVNTEPVVWHLVRLLTSQDDFSLKTKIGKLAQVLVEFQPELRVLLATKKKAFEQAVQGLGCHGLTTDATGLTHLHAALKTEIQLHIESYKTALHKLDELGLATNHTKKPVDASHHRLLSLHFEDVQQRLIDNTTLLTVLDKPTLKQLRILTETLTARVQSDKEALFCISQLKRLQPIDEEKPVATLLMSFSRGCGALLELMLVPDSPCNSDGYHSESEQETDTSDIVTSPFHLDYLLLDTRDILELWKNPNQAYNYFKQLEALVAYQYRQGLDPILNWKEAVDRYSTLYYQSRPRALEALDSLPELLHATQLKSKILFSVVVLAFRTCKNIREAKLREVLSTLRIDGRTSVAQTLRVDIMRGLAASSDTYPLIDAEDQVLQLLCDTLREYKCLETCMALRRYVSNVVRVCWFIVNQDPPYEMDTDFQTPVRLQSERHIRHHSSDRRSEVVRAYLWPGLITHTSWAHKAVVVTN